jgi:hypothetical protein
MVGSDMGWWRRYVQSSGKKSSEDRHFDRIDINELVEVLKKKTNDHEETETD